MIDIGKYADLEVVKEVEFGLYLDGGPFGEILLPIRYVPKGVRPGDELRVFIYCDSEDRIIATTEKPYATVGEFAYLKVNGISSYGAFLDWGLSKDLFVPFREQKYRMEMGEQYLVMIYLDEITERIAASSKLNKFLEDEGEPLEQGMKVELLIAEETDLGYKAIINEQRWGVLYYNEIFQEIEIGDVVEGYIKNIREDEKIDLSLQAQGYLQQIPIAVQQVLDKLKENDGFLPLTDKSSPDDIYDTFEMSKKSFKKAIGKLYKDRFIQLEKEGIRLIAK